MSWLLCSNITPEKFVPKLRTGGYHYDIQIPNTWISLFTVVFKIWKRICKTVVMNSSLFSAKHACTCETAVLENSFSNSFSDFPPKKTERREIQGQHSQRWNSFLDIFMFECKSEIRISKFKSTFPNHMHSMVARSDSQLHAFEILVLLLWLQHYQEQGEG